MQHAIVSFASRGALIALLTMVLGTVDGINSASSWWERHIESRGTFSPMPPNFNVDGPVKATQGGAFLMESILPVRSVPSMQP